MTKAQRHMQNVASLGCIACRRTGKGATPAEVHHILRNGKRIDDFSVLPLCTRHHREGVNDEHYVSRHPWKREFEKRYGTEQELLELTMEDLANVGTVSHR